MKKMLTPKFLFHLTTKKSWREKIKLLPKNKGKNRGIGEPEVSRICVGPNITRCLLALPYSSHETYYIYRTYNKTQAYYPYEVDDSCVTQEKWITVPTTFIKIGVISPKIIKELPDETCCFVGEQRKALPKIKKILRDNLHVPVEYI